jgi:methylenetetrahydrofolate dehydrogenase (NADP+)/methenyltetrahydrofolate cyclohydrolase
VTLLIDGKQYANALRNGVRLRAEEFARSAGRRPRLDAIIVGEHPASRTYVRTKTRMAEETVIEGRLIELPDSIDGKALLDRIACLNDDPVIDGVLVQLPLPTGVKSGPVIEAIDAGKDVDGFHPLNVGRLFTAAAIDPEKLMIPCTPLGCLMMLKSVLGPSGLRGRTAVVIGRSNIVGSPMAKLLTANDCTVTVAHSQTANLPELCRAADILVAAVARPGFVRGDWIKDGAVVIDVGINRVASPNGGSQIAGDVATREAMGRAGHITPVPGGVGPMTVACLLHNTIVAAEMRAAAKPIL